MARGRSDSIAETATFSSGSPRSTVFTYADQATFLARAALYDGDYRAANRFVDDLRRVRPEDVRRVAREYMHNFRFVYIGDPAKLPKEYLTNF